MSHKRKNLDYYRGLSYPIRIELEEFDDGETQFIAYCNELGRGSCYGLSETEEQALADFKEAKDEFIEILFERGLPIPEPTNEDRGQLLSGIFNVRTTQEIHTKIARQAADKHISLNKYVNELIIVGSVKDEFMEKLDVRIRQLEEKISKKEGYQITYNIIGHEAQSSGMLVNRGFEKWYEDNFTPQTNKKLLLSY